MTVFPEGGVPYPVIGHAGRRAPYLSQGRSRLAGQAEGRPERSEHRLDRLGRLDGALSCQLIKLNSTKLGGEPAGAGRRLHRRGGLCRVAHRRLPGDARLMINSGGACASGGPYVIIPAGLLDRARPTPAHRRDLRDDLSSAESSSARPSWYGGGLDARRRPAAVGRALRRARLQLHLARHQPAASS